MNYLDAFLQEIRAAGYEPVNGITPDSPRWGRLLYNGEKRSSGRYKLFTDAEKAIGIYGSDKDPSGFITWKSWDGEKLDNDQIKDRRAWHAEVKRKLKEIETRRWDILRDWYTAAWSNFDKTADTHSYVKKKQIKTFGSAKVRKKNGALVLPIMRVDDKKSIWSYQYIHTNGFKQFTKHARLKGGVVPCVNNPPDESRIYICEGWATACTIRELTGCRTYAALTAGNLKDAAIAVKKEYPDCAVIMAADNDQFPSDNWPKNKKWVNTGVTKSQQAAAAIDGAMVCIPEFEDEFHDEKPTDWNDFFLIYGEERTKLELLRLNPVTPQGSEDRQTPVTSKNPPPAHSNFSGYEHQQVTEKNWEQHVHWKDGVVGIFDEKHSLANAILWLSFQPQWLGSFVYDEFDHTCKVVKPLPWDDKQVFKWRTAVDTDYTQLRALLNAKKMKIGSNTEMKQVVEVVALNKKVHPVREFFDTLKWDGTPRLDNWLIDYCGATEQPEDYIKAVGSCFLKASVKRVYNAGEKVDSMMVLEGAQGTFKSTLLRKIATFSGIEYFSDSVSFDDIGNKHAAAYLQGRLIIEFAELTGLSAKDRNKIKAWITMTQDEVQQKFKNEVTVYPRQFILAGSTNDSTWMSDPTGGRRFWPVKVGKILLDEIELIKEQLWAEAIHRVKMGEKHYIEDNDPVYKQAQAEQAARYEGHVWEDAISDYVASRYAVTIDEILTECLFMSKERWTNRHKAEIGDILRNFGWDNKPKYCTTEKKMLRKWRKPETELKILEGEKV